MTAVLRVAVPVPLPRLFDYLPPPGLPAPATVPGARVLVPFGKRELVGIVMDTGDPVDDPRGMREAIRWLDDAPVAPAEWLATLRWCATYYAHPIGETVATALPVALRRAVTPRLPDLRPVALTAAGIAALATPTPRAGTAAHRLLIALRDAPLAPDVARTRAGDVPASAVQRALAAGWIERRALSAWQSASPVPGSPVPSEAQAAAIAAVGASFDRFGAFLLDGVTGSGKTEVYLQLVRRAVDAGRQCLVLVPEIALTPQALARYRERLGLPVLALHSGVADGERAAAWCAAAQGDAPVVLGTRSAVFTPMRHAGLIIVDEEHDASYKQQDGLRYGARDVAVMRAHALSVPIVLGSATPSLESVANVRTGRYTSLRLPERAGHASMPRVDVIDLRRQRLVDGLAAPAIAALRDCVARGDQALVFRNRRGFAPLLLCHDCGWHAECPRCDSAMTVHQRSGRLRCHHCGHDETRPRACPACGQQELVALGAGTERLETTLRAHLPDDVPVLRIDRDTTHGRDAFDALHEQLAADGPAVLVGTQMLAKGHDLPRLTLAVIATVDEGLFSADFRAAERLAQLVVQVAGRAGRGERPGRVLLQTHHPDHPLLQRLLRDGYAGFAEEELTLREATGFPPYARLALLRAEAQDEAPIAAFLAAARDRFAQHADVVLRGPMPAPKPRRAGFQRMQLLIESTRRAPLHAALAAEVPALHEGPLARRVRWSVDVDPVDLY